MRITWKRVEAGYHTGTDGAALYELQLGVPDEKNVRRGWFLAIDGRFQEDYWLTLAEAKQAAEAL